MAAGMLFSAPALAWLEYNIIKHVYKATSKVRGSENTEAYTIVYALATALSHSTEQSHRLAIALRILLSFYEESGSCFCCGASGHSLLERPYEVESHYPVVLPNGRESECPIPHAQQLLQSIQPHQGDISV